ncbi:hypothetical protein B0O80DRAFT_432548, partial [Mortierella sp. GBAus27b]
MSAFTFIVAIALRLCQSRVLWTMSIQRRVMIVTRNSMEEYSVPRLSANWIVKVIMEHGRGNGPVCMATRIVRGAQRRSSPPCVSRHNSPTTVEGGS